MFVTDLLSIIRSLNAVHTAIGICQASYVDWLLADSQHNLLTYLLTPWCRVLLEKLTGLQLVKKFPPYHGTRRFITALTSVRKQASRMWVFLNILFYREGLLAHRPTPKLEDHPPSAVRDCLFNLFAATLLIGGRSPIRNLRTRHAVVTGTHYSQHNWHDKYLLLCIQCWDCWWWTVDLSETCKVLHQNNFEK